MPFNHSDIATATQPRPPRVVLIGTEKIGKSTFGSQSPAPLFIPVQGETGLDWIKGPRTPPVKSYMELIEILEWLGKADHNYQTAVLDSWSAFEPMLCAHAVQAEGVRSLETLGGGFGRQEGVLNTYVRVILDWMDYLRDAKGMGCIIVAHVKPNPKTFNDPETDPYDTYKVEWRESIGATINRWSDAILFATTKKYTRTVSNEGDKKKVVHASGAGERVIYTERRPAFPAGCRFKIPFELPLEFAAFEKAYREAEAAYKNN